jgi:hypothetical protein
MSAYNIFCFDNYKVFAAVHPGIKAKQATSLISKAWKRMTKSEKESYEQRSAAAR